MENPAFVKDPEASLTPRKEEDGGIEHDKQLFGSKARQILCASSIASGLYLLSFLIGSTSMLPTILERNSNQTYTSEDVKWLASAPILSTIPGCFFGFLLTKKIGPSIIIRLIFTSSFIIYTLMAFFPTVAILSISRSLLYFNIGIFDIVAVPLISELSEPNIRGVCGVFPELIVSSGLILSSLSFHFFDEKVATLCNAIPVVFALITSSFIPESPYWLIEHGEHLKAKQSYARILGPSRKEDTTKMFEETLLCYTNNTSNKIDSSEGHLKLLSKARNWKPLLIILIVFGFREFGGSNIIFFYSLQIFQEANINVDIFLCTIILGVTRLFSTFVSSLLQDRLGRRKILFGSLAVSALCLLIGGIILYLDIKALKLVPLIAIMIFILMVGVGMGPTPFVLLGELIQTEVKFASTLVFFSLFSLYQFSVVNILPSLLEIFSVGLVFIGLAAINFTCIIVLYIILPETKLKTRAELDSLYKDK